MGTPRYACHRPEINRAPEEHRWKPGEMSTSIGDGERVEKRSETSAMCTKSAEVCQVVGSVPADRQRLITETLADTPPIIKKKNAVIVGRCADQSTTYLGLITEIIPDSTKNSSVTHCQRIGTVI